MILISGFLSTFYKPKYNNDDYFCQDCNLILISIDSLRADHLGAYGYGKNTSPNIDELASEGIMFKNYITQAYLTPISEFSMHSSLYPHEHGLAISNKYGQQHPLTNPPETIASILKKYNYSNIALSTSPEFSNWEEFKTGFDSFTFFESRNLPNINKTFMQNLKNKKFFLWIAIGTVHSPYGYYVPEQITRKYVNPNYDGIFKNYTRLDNFVLLNIYNYSYYNKSLDVFLDFEYRPIFSGTIDISQEDIDFILAKYDAGIEYVDQYIGNFSKILKDLDLDKNTIVIITSSHGEEFGEHGYVFHYDIHESETHVPLIIEHPKLKHRVIEYQTQSLDVLPTLLDFLKIPKYEKARGQSLVPLIINSENSSFDKFVFIERTPLLEEFGAMNLTLSQLHYDFAIRTNEWKLIYRSSKDFEMNNSWYQNISGQKIYVPEFELYNIKEDPKEQHNLFFSRKDIADDLKAQLFDWLKEVNQSTFFNRTEIKNKEIFPYP